MKIAQIAPPWLPVPPKNYGGTEAIVAYLTEELVALGHDVTLFAPGDARTSAKHVAFFPQSLIEAGVPWHAPLQSYYHLHSALEQAQDFDIVHTHLSSSADMYLFPLMAARAVPGITTLHSNFPFDRYQDWVGWGDQYYMKWAEHVPIVTVSNYARLHLPPAIRCLGTVHLAVPTTSFQAKTVPREPFFAWLGRIFYEKGPHLAIAAARRLNRPLILAGTIDRHIQESVDYFKQMIEPHIDGEMVQYIGPVDMVQKIDLLSRAHAFLNPIQWEEPGATVVIEAMALGCPVISFKRGVLPEIVLHERTGFLVDNLDDMITCMERVPELDHKEIRQHFEAHFSARAMALKYVQLYEQLIASREVLTAKSA